MSSVQHPYSGTECFGKFGKIRIPVPPATVQNFIPVPDTSVSSVQHQYHFGNFGTTSVPVSDTSVEVRYKIHTGTVHTGTVPNTPFLATFLIKHHTLRTNTRTSYTYTMCVSTWYYTEDIDAAACCIPTTVVSRY